jgi:hypothetical protein
MSQAGCPITNVRCLVNRHHSRYGCLSLPNTAQRIPNQQPTATSTLTSLSVNSSSSNAPAQPPLVSMSSTVTPLSSSDISRSTVRPVNLDKIPPMPSSVRRIPPVASNSTTPLIVDEDEDEEEGLEDNAFRGQDVDIGGDVAFGADICMPRGKRTCGQRNVAGRM